jgi:hypothetical protein
MVMGRTKVTGRAVSGRVTLMALMGLVTSSHVTTVVNMSVKFNFRRSIVLQSRSHLTIAHFHLVVHRRRRRRQELAPQSQSSSVVNSPSHFATVFHFLIYNCQNVANFDA